MSQKLTQGRVFKKILELGIVWEIALIQFPKQRKYSSGLKLTALLLKVELPFSDCIYYIVMTENLSPTSRVPITLTTCYILQKILNKC